MTPEAILDAPAAQSRWQWLHNVLPPYRAITIMMANYNRVAGVPFIERFAQDQSGRDFIVAISECGRLAAVMVHKKHLKNSYQIKLETQRKA